MSKSMAKNNITTQSYFVKRLRDQGFYVVKLFDRYNDDDYRKWTVLLNPKKECVYVTCIDNGEWPYKGLYELYDTGRLFPRGFQVNTESIDVVVKHLLEFNVTQPELNNKDGREKKKRIF